LFDDLICGFCPWEGLELPVVILDVAFDGGLAKP
jgi:hypothetical protein